MKSELEQSAYSEQEYGQPKNFGRVNERLYRGSWPQSPDFLSNFGITEVVTLFSSSDRKEAEWIVELQNMLAKHSIKHFVIDIQKNDNLWIAAQHIYDSDGWTYVHCQAGANRTSMVCLISEIMRLGPKIASELIPTLINDAICHGFDYHKEKYQQILHDVLTQAQDKGLLLYWFLP